MANIKSKDMILGRRKLGWRLIGLSLIGVSLYFYFGQPFIKNQIVHDRSRVIKNDLMTLTTPEIDETKILKSLLNLPEWYRNGDWGLKRNKSLEGVATEILQNKYTREDYEVQIAWKNFFYGTTNGIVLELGAMDGKSLSVSHFFETQAGWRSILIEGNPIKAAFIPKNRPNAINFNAVICDKPKMVHYAQDGPVSGIVEFMTQGHLTSYYRHLLTNGTIDEKKLARAMNVIKVPCVPLSHFLNLLKIYHINFFMLDVEGGELNVLKAIDFGRIKFDVIAVETARISDSKEAKKIYVDAVIEFLTSKGYILSYRKIGRNSWFRHPDFTGFSRGLTSLTNFTKT